MTLEAAYGLLGQALVFGALGSLLPLGELRGRAGLAATTIALFAGIAPAMHGFFGAPSLTLLQLALLQLANRPAAPLAIRSNLFLMAFFALFYSASLGWGPFDPYALGYQPWALLAALVPVAFALWWRRLDTALLILAVDLAGYALGLFDNLWDALVDPLLALMILAQLARPAVLWLIATVRR
jgi:hypothetical protein